MDINYLFHRQQVERTRAKGTTSHVAREIHEQLASEYERQIEEVTDGRITFVSKLPERVGEREATCEL